MKNLFYFKNENLLCWIAGYTEDTNTSNVLKQISSLQENAECFSDVAGVPTKNVHTRFVENSIRYKYMRVFYAAVLPENVPGIAYEIDGDWTMNSWLTY